MYSLIAPVYITLPRKTKKDKTIPLSLNWYRNSHYIISNQVKVAFKEHMRQQILQLPMFGKISIHFDYYSKTKQRSDLGNWVSVCEKFFLDALVELGKLEDDSMHYVTNTSAMYCGCDPSKQGKIIITIREEI